MDELVALVAKQTGLAPDKARGAVDTVLSFVKGRLPAPVAGQLDALIAGGAASQAPDLTSRLGGMSSGLTDTLGGGSEGADT